MLNLLIPLKPPIGISKWFFFKFFSDDKRRCVNEAETSCEKKPDMVRLRSEPTPVVLRVSELNSFFARWASL